MSHSLQLSKKKITSEKNLKNMVILCKNGSEKLCKSADDLLWYDSHEITIQICLSGSEGFQIVFGATLQYWIKSEWGWLNVSGLWCLFLMQTDDLMWTEGGVYQRID